jgi:hypothetical protein
MMAALIGTLLGWVGCGFMVWGWGFGSTVGKCVFSAYFTSFMIVCVLGISGAFLAP